MQNNANQSIAVKALAIVGILAILLIIILVAVKLSEGIATLGAKATTQPAIWVSSAESALSSAASSPSVGSVVSVYQQPATTQTATPIYTTQPATTYTAPTQVTPTQTTYYVPPTQTTTAYPVGTPVQTQINGRPDLAVTILSTGIVDPTTGAFTATNLINPNQRAAVRFQVQNLGTAPTGSWQFNAVVRQFSQEIFSSPIEPSLNPGDKIVYTISYDGIWPDNTNTSVSTFTVNVNPNGSMVDANLNNDIATTQFNIIQN